MIFGIFVTVFFTVEIGFSRGSDLLLAFFFSGSFFGFISLFDKDDDDLVVFFSFSDLSDFFDIFDKFSLIKSISLGRISSSFWNFSNSIILSIENLQDSAILDFSCLGSCDKRKNESNL